MKCLHLIYVFSQVCKALARFHAAGILLAHKDGREAAIQICPELKLNAVLSNDYSLGGVYLRNSSVDALSAALMLMLTSEERPQLKLLQVTRV